MSVILREGIASTKGQIYKAYRRPQPLEYITLKSHLNPKNQPIIEQSQSRSQKRKKNSIILDDQDYYFDRHG